MIEYYDIYDENRNFLGRSEIRGEYKFKKGEYHIVTDSFIFNSKNELLITRRCAEKKNFPLLWEGNGGSLLKGETSEEAIIREIKEEIGLTVDKSELVLYKSFRVDEEYSPRFKDLYIIKKDFDVKDLVLQKEEVMDAKWVSLDEYKKMMDNKEIVPILNFDENDFEKAINILNKEK